MSALLLAPVLEPARNRKRDRVGARSPRARWRGGARGGHRRVRRAAQCAARVAAASPRLSTTTAWSTTTSCWRRWRRAGCCDDATRPRAGARIPRGARAPSGETRGAALARNLAWVVERAAAFAADPRATNLVGIKPGRMTGNWRDSEQGLGRGRYPYDVNAALVPAALDAAARLVDERAARTRI